MRNLVKQETEEHRREQEAQTVQAQRDSENEEKKPKLLTLLMQSSSGSNLHKDNISNMYMQTPKSLRNQPFLSPAEYAAEEAAKFGGFKVLDVNENIRNSLKMPPRSSSALMTPVNRKSQPSKYQRSRSSLNTSLTLDGVKAQSRSLEKKQNHVVNRLSQPKGTKIIKIKTKKNDVLENSFVIDQILDHFLDNLDGQQDAQTSRASRTHRPKHNTTSNRNRRPMTPGNTMLTSKHDPIPLDEFNLFPEDDRKLAKGLNYSSIPSVKKKHKEKSKYALRKHIDLQEQ